MNLHHPINPSQQLAEIAEKVLLSCDSLEAGQALRPCRDAIQSLIEGDSQRPRIEILDFAEGASWLKLGIAQAISRTSRELSRHKNVTAHCEPSRLSRKPIALDREPARLKDSVTALLARVERTFNQESERCIQPLGEWTKKLREITSELSLHDLEQTQTSTQLRLTVNAGHLAGLSRRVEHEIRSRLNRDLKSVQYSVTKGLDSIFRDFELGDDSERFFQPRKIDEKELWKSIENLITVGKESHIEIQRRGIFDILTAGRQKVFMVIMFLSLMGRMGLPDLFQSTASKTTFGLFLAGVMISSMISSILLWRREKSEQSEKELLKIRDSLFQDGMRIVEQVEKAKLQAAKEFIKDLAVGIDSRMKSWQEEVATKQKLQLDESLRKADLKKKSLEQRAKVLVDIERELNKHLEAVVKLETCKQLEASKASNVQSTVEAEESVNPERAILAASEHSPRKDSSPTKETRGIKEAAESAKPRTSGLAERRMQRLAALGKA